MTTLRILLGLALLASPAAADPQADWAIVQQETLPALDGRLDAATAKIEARTAYFAGDAAFEVSFPKLVGAELQRRSVLVSRLALLDDAEAARAAERVASRPDLGDPARDGVLDAALSAALDAEDRADALERRLLLALRAMLDRQPLLRAESLQQHDEQLTAELEAAGDPASDPEAARRIAAIDEDRLRMAALVRQLMRVATVPGAAVPSPDEDIARLAGARSEAAMARLERLLPFLPTSQRADTEAAMVAWYETTRIPELEARLAAGYRPTAASLDELREELDEADRQLDAARAALPDAVPTTALVAARQRVAGLRRDLAANKRQTIAGTIGLMQQAQASQSDEQNAAQSAAKAAAEAVVAREAADQALDQRLSNRRLDAADRAGQAWTETEAMADTLDEAGEKADGKLEEFATKTETAELPILGAELPDDIANANELYGELRTYIGELRDGVDKAYERHDEVAEARTKAMAVVATERAEIAQSKGALSSKPAVRAEQIASLEAWTASLDREVEAWDARLARASAERDDAFRRLRRAKAIRRALAGKTTATVRAQDEFLLELQFELGMLGQNLSTLVSDRISS